jgi:alanine-glyoxylate transaminase/serine-glyoxylate transaminase/serine-pyruvate transaminase
VILREEGLANAWERHRTNHRKLRAGLEELKLRFFVPESERMPQLNVVAIPEGVDDARTRGRLLSEYGLEIGAGLGPMAGRIWRIGLMGYASNPRNALYCVQALRAVLA